jgi:hypothetical protein
MICLHEERKIRVLYHDRRELEEFETGVIRLTSFDGVWFDLSYTDLSFRCASAGRPGEAVITYVGATNVNGSPVHKLPDKLYGIRDRLCHG